MYQESVWPLVIYAAVVVFVVATMVGLSYILGQRHRSRARDTPFESGVLPVGSARLRLSVSYYLVAALFLIFDLEAAFLFAWAVSALELGWSGYVGVVVFTAVLFCMLVYLGRAGALSGYGAVPVDRRTGGEREKDALVS